MPGSSGGKSRARPSPTTIGWTSRLSSSRRPSRSSQRTVVGLPDMVMSPPSWALMPVSCWATSPLRISEFCHPAACRLLETTYFLIEFMTSPNGSPACSGQYPAHSLYRTRPISKASVVANPAATAAPHLVIEIPEMPLVGRLDDTVERHEEVRLDLAH